MSICVHVPILGIMIPGDHFFFGMGWNKRPQAAENEPEAGGNHHGWPGWCSPSDVATTSLMNCMKHDIHSTINSAISLEGDGNSNHFWVYYGLLHEFTEYHLVIKHGVLENPRTEWKFLAWKNPIKFHEKPFTYGFPMVFLHVWWHRKVFLGLHQKSEDWGSVDLRGLLPLTDAWSATSDPRCPLTSGGITRGWPVNPSTAESWTIEVCHIFGSWMVAYNEEIHVSFWIWGWHCNISLSCLSCMIDCISRNCWWLAVQLPVAQPLRALNAIWRNVFVLKLHPSSEIGAYPLVMSNA